MKLERFLFILDGYSNPEEIYNIYITEQKYEKGQYVKWTPELQEAWDKSIATQIYKNGVDEHSGWKLGFCPNSDCSENLSERYDKKYCPHCGQKLIW